MEKKKTNYEQAKAYFEYAEKYFEKKEFLISLELDKNAINNFTKAHKEENKAQVFSHIAKIHYSINDFENALKNYFKALEIYEKEENSLEVFRTKKNIADLYLRIDKCDQAFEYLFEVKKYYESDNIKTPQDKTSLLQSIGIAYGRCGSLDSALFYFEEAIQGDNQTDDLTMKGGLLNNIGAIYSKKENNEKALEYYNKALVIFKKDSVYVGVGVSKSNIAYILKKKGDYKNSKDLFLEALTIFKENDALIYLRDNYLNISEVFQLSGDYKSALEYSNLYLDLNDSITNSDIVSRMSDLQMQFEIKKKDQELLIIEKDKKLSEFSNYLLIGGLTLVLLVVFLLFLSLKANKLKQKVLRHEKEELKSDINYKNSEIEGFALRIVEKNNLLVHLKKEIKQIVPNKEENIERIKTVSQAINNNLYLEKDRKEFDFQLNKLHQSFFLKLDKKHPDLTKNEKRICSLIVLDLSTKEIATILNISIDGVKKGRYRLRKKLTLNSDVSIGLYLKNL
ncbi:MAG: tetratricopeptide repeat protein [Fluviicola sp.]|nr:tetratricopeptide repeat protein [Fluviicola sp.]